MPLYVFKCPVCGREQEAIQRPGDAPPECQGLVGRGTPVGHVLVDMDRQLSAPGFRLKGGDGYYGRGRV